MAYVLSCCSTVDVTPEHLKARDISFIPFHYYLDGVEHTDDMGASMPLDKFYEAMTNGADTRTAQVNTEEYVAQFEKHLQSGKDVLHLTLSSGISGTVNSALLAKAQLEEKYPGRHVNIVDSLAASAGFGLLMDELADRRDAGMTLEELTQWAIEYRTKINHWFFSTDLTFFVKGGRVSKTSGFIGNLLSICPLLNVDYQGRLIVRDKVRTKRKVYREMVDRMEKLADGGLDYNGRVYISHSACMADARAVADIIEEKFTKLPEKVQIFDIGTTIGSHTGPGTVALFFVGAERKD